MMADARGKNGEDLMDSNGKSAQNLSSAVLDAVPHPILTIAGNGHVIEANVAAETFFQVSTPLLRRRLFSEFVPFGSPLLGLIEQVRERGAPVNEYRVDLGTPRNGGGNGLSIFTLPRWRTIPAMWW